MPAPTVTAASPNIGSTQGGTNITLTGTNFTGATGVTIGGVAATDVVVVSATSITCTTPTGSAGVGSILVTNASGTNGANSLFFYIAATPTDTYIYLRGGRGDGFVPTWTGTVAEQGMVDTSGAIVGSDGKEVSEPYRDVFQSSAEFATLAGRNNISAPGIIANAIAAGGGTGGIEASFLADSDEVAHVKPRQYFKVFTWLVFTSSNGLTYKFRKADIIGWGSRARA